MLLKDLLSKIHPSEFIRIEENGMRFKTFTVAEYTIKSCYRYLDSKKVLEIELEISSKKSKPAIKITLG